VRHDPERFVTFVLGAFALLYYFGVSAQIARVHRKLGRSPVMWGATALERAKVLAAFLWPLVVLAWAHSPQSFAGLPHFPRLENWPVRLLGVLLLSLGVALATIAYGELGEHWRIGVDPSQKSTIVRAGIYASIRHPVYSALWLMLLGFFLLAPNLLFALLWAGGSSVITAQADAEERHMTRLHGKAYRDYCLTSGKFFPLFF